MVSRPATYASVAFVLALAASQAHADVMSFKLLPNYSRATFKSDAPLETFVGNTAAEGVDGTLSLDTEVEANRWVTFEVKSIEIAGALEPGKMVPAKVKGVLTVKQKPVERVADATVTWIKLTPEEVEAQKRFGFTADNIKVRARFATTFTDHGLKIPAILFYKVSNDIQLETDLTFIRQ